jgi:hypothetical protein
MSLFTTFADSDTEVLDAGFSEVEENGAQEELFVCPHCGVAINNKEDVVLTGDTTCCKTCKKPLFERVDSTPLIREDTDAIGREEFAAYWDEIMSLEEEASDYEVDD